MSASNLIAFAALIIAGLSASYSRGARNEASRANKIAILESRRPLRLQAFQAMHHFSHYCSTYWTLYHLREVNGGKELTSRIDTFKWEIDQHGHLDMPDVEEKAQQFISHAWKMQRLIDRIASGQNQALDTQYASAVENMEALGDWFVQENIELRSLFQPYLSVA